MITVMWGYGDGWGWGAWLIMGFSMILFWALIIAGVIALVRYLGAPHNDNGSSTGNGLADAERILAERFARGEIDEDEYRQRRESLRSGR